MHGAQLLWLSVLGGASLLYLWLAATLLRRRAGPGSRSMGLALGAVAVWLATSVAEVQAPAGAAHLAIVALKYTAVALTPAAYLLSVLHYTERFALRSAHLALLFLVPLATIGVVWSNPWHEWMWAHPPLGPHGERLIRLDWGPWFRWVHVPASYAMAGAALLVSFGELSSQSKLYRAQTATLVVAVMIPLVANILYTAGFGSAAVGLTPLAFAASGLFLAWGFVRMRLFRLSPIAYHSVFDHMRDGVVVIDRYRRVVDANRTALVMCGRSQAELVGYRVEDVLPWRDAVEAALASAGEAAAASRTGGGPRACRAADGRTLELAVSSIRRREGRSAGEIVLLRDVSERERAEAALRGSEARMRQLVEHSPSGILQLRPKLGPAGDVRDFVCVLANPAAAALLSETPERLEGRPFKDAVHPHTPALFQLFRDAVLRGETCDVERAIVRHERESWFRFIAAPFGGDLLVTFFDVTDRKLREREMEAAASQDPLTGLLNRRGFEADAPAVLRAAATAATSCCLLYLDLDGLKQVNDTFGHDAGDYLLAEFAARVHACTRGPDLFARLGGDEFALLLPETDLSGALDVARRIVAALAEPVRIGASLVSGGVSIGIAEHPRHGSELKDLLQSADRAMYTAKSRGGGVELAPQTGSFGAPRS